MFVLCTRTHTKRARIASFIFITALAAAYHAPLLSVHAEDQGTPVASSSCHASEMSSEDYAAAVSNRPDASERSYVPSGTASGLDADAARDTLNHYAACRESGEYRQARSLYTHYGLYWSHTNAHNFEEWNDHQMARIGAGFALSPAFDQEAAVAVQDDNGATPAAGTGTAYFTEFSAENVILLDDGRVAVLHTVVLPAGSQLADDPLIAEMGTATILMNVDGTWLIDETLPLCFANCEVNRAMLESVLLILPAATPAND